MEKGKRVGTMSGEIVLPEALIQHIQSFLSGKEAARTTVLSKAWYSAWLTRPTLDLTERDFWNPSWESPLMFERYVEKTMLRYRDLSLKIDTFRLRTNSYQGRDIALKSWIVNAMELGPTELVLGFLHSFTLPQEVFASENLLKLSVKSGRVDGNNYVISCSRLRTLSLEGVNGLSDDVLSGIVSCCHSIEELVLSYNNGSALSMMNLYELPRLRRLNMVSVDVDSMFFSDFASRFPCLKYLTIHGCRGCTRIEIASTSLETISFQPYRLSNRVKFDIPNIRKFTCSTTGLPHLSITTTSREWEFDISINSNRFHNPSWFLKLKKVLKKFSLSRICLSITAGRPKHEGSSEHEVDIEVLPDPVVVENLKINAATSFCSAFLVRLFGIFRPKFVTALFFPRSNAFIAILYKRLMHQVITPNCGIPDQSLFGQFNLKKVNMEVYKWPDREPRQPLVLEKPLDPSETTVEYREIRFELIWDYDF